MYRLSDRYRNPSLGRQSDLSIGNPIGSHFSVLVALDQYGEPDDSRNHFLVNVAGQGNTRAFSIVRHGEGVTEDDIREWMDEPQAFTNVKVVYTGEASTFIDSKLQPTRAGRNAFSWQTLNR
ncbi:MAG: hypothetical protein HRT94_05135 [Alphaproteobacteria bacterium]|nr:hypothetical protein [Alphaproteobacteria bacterium]